jgi:hypothetical protein
MHLLVDMLHRGVSDRVNRVFATHAEAVRLYGRWRAEICRMCGDPRDLNFVGANNCGIEWPALREGRGQGPRLVLVRLGLMGELVSLSVYVEPALAPAPVTSGAAN